MVPKKPKIPKAKGTPRGIAGMPHQKKPTFPVPTPSRLRGVAVALPVEVLISRPPQVIDTVRAEYERLGADAKSVSVSVWPLLCDDTLSRLLGRAFAGTSPKTGLPLKAGRGATATAAVDIGLAFLLEDPGVRLAVETGSALENRDGGTRQARAFVLDIWKRRDVTLAGSLHGDRSNIWLAGETANTVNTLASAIGTKPTSVIVAAACIAFAAEPVATDDERLAMAEVAASFVEAVRVKAVAVTALAEALL